MKIVNIGGKDYTFEFTMEASLYNECTEKVTEAYRVKRLQRSLSRSILKSIRMIILVISTGLS